MTVTGRKATITDSSGRETPETLLASMDWARTPFGSRDSWPEVLSVTTGLLMNASVPMMLLWGTDARAIYNAAFMAFAGDHHPALFGQPIDHVWPEFLGLEARVLGRVQQGECVSLKDNPLLVEHAGVRDEFWLTLDYSPIRSLQGQICGALCIMKNTTERVRTERRLRIAQAVGGIGTFEWYPDCGRMAVSDEFRDIWGLKPDVPVTDTMLLQLMHPEDREATLERLKMLDQRNPLEYTEYRRIDPRNGNIHWIARRGEEVTGANGEARRYIGVAYDITERKRAEREQMEHESRWRNLFEQMHEGFFLAEAIRNQTGEIEDFRFLEWNAAFEEQAGLSAAEMNDRSARSLLPDLDAETIATYGRVIETGQPAEFEIHLKTPAGRWYEARANKVKEDRFAVLLLDVTSRKTAEQSILESEAKFRLLAQSMPNHVWTARADGKPDWFNERVYDFAGLNKGELDSENWLSLVHPDDRERTLEAWQSAVANGHLYKCEFRLRRRDGVYRWHIVRAVPIRNKAGSIKRWIGTNTDIDDQKSAEAALADFAATLEQRVETRTAELLKTQDALRQSQKMEAIGNLTGGIAHDFNNLLQVISGNLHLIAKDMAGHPKLEERLQNAIKGVTRGAKLASQLLAFGRRQPLAPKVLNIGRLLNNMDDILHRALGEAITVETQIEDNLWNTEIDPSNVENAILNLAINARDAMDDNGHLVIEVRNVIVDTYSMRGNMELSEGQYVMFAVHDSGCGMSQEVMEKVFEPFFTTKPEGKGTGLGLSMVYGFVKQSGGHVIIESQVGKGTTIRIYLPRAVEGEDQDGSGTEETQPIRGGTETILVAEDDEAVRETVVAILSDLGYRVLRARDGNGALTILESGAPVDLLFTDMIMPGTLKSSELVRRAREHQPDIEVLFTSGYPEGSSGTSDTELGIELLQKPYSREALALKVRRTLDKGGSTQWEDQPPTAVQVKSTLSALTETASTPVPAETGKPFEKGNKIIILLCEDDYLIRLTTAEILEDEGFVVLEAGAGQDALSLLAQYPDIDILMTDFGLPDMTGVELANRARDARPGLPVLFATGHVEVENLPAGPTRQVTKPFSDESLLEAINALMG